jgi:hypothetical protein
MNKGSHSSANNFDCALTESNTHHIWEEEEIDHNVLDIRKIAKVKLDGESKSGPFL